MANLYGIVKVAAVQASSIFLDCEGTTEKACRLIREAGSCARAAGRVRFVTVPAVALPACLPSIRGSRMMLPIAYPRTQEFLKRWKPHVPSGLCPTLARLAALLLATLAPVSTAHADDNLIVGKPSAIDFYFSLQQVGIDAGIFKKEGLEITTVALGGSGKLHQALTAGSVDIGLGSGTDLNFVAKGAPEKAVAEMAGPPVNMYVLVSNKSNIKSVADLKGKRMGISTMGSLTYWLATQLSRHEGWGDNGFQLVTAGNVQAEAAAFVSGELDAAVASLEAGLTMQAKGEGYPLVSFGNIVKTFMVHTIFATDTLMTKRPDVLRHYLRAWFETVAYAKSHKDETIRLSRPVTHLSPEAAEKLYDVVVPTLSTDGKFDPQAVRVILQSLVDMGQIKTLPDAKSLYTEKFLP